MNSYLKDLFGIELNRFDIKRKTYKMEVLWTDDNQNYMKLFELSPTWFIFKDKCGYFYPRIGTLLLVQKNKSGNVICETEYNFETRKFYTTEYKKNHTIETLTHFNHKNEPVCETKMITTYRDNRKVSTSYCQYA